MAWINSIYGSTSILNPKVIFIDMLQLSLSISFFIFVNYWKLLQHDSVFEQLSVFLFQILQMNKQKYLMQNSLQKLIISQLSTPPTQPSLLRILFPLLVSSTLRTCRRRLRHSVYIPFLHTSELRHYQQLLVQRLYLLLSSLGYQLHLLGVQLSSSCEQHVSHGSIFNNNTVSNS